MVTRRTEACQNPGRPKPDWKQALAQAYSDPLTLLQALDLTPDQIPDLDPTPGAFRLLVPRGFAALMTPGDPHDPLLRQVLPLGAEHRAADGFVLDPVGDGQATRTTALIQKYQGRALLMAHGACAVHCRYCFRRHYPYSDMGAYQERTDTALQVIAGDPSLSEVILSGGDPLMLDDNALTDLLRRLDAMSHLQRLRLHTRLPVVLPERITERLCAQFRSLRLRPVLVIHANHGRELGENCANALEQLRSAGVTLLNQSVLLEGVNADTDTLTDLSSRLFTLGVLPYYLHQLDPVQGAAHFSVSNTRAVHLAQTLRERLPGYLVPRLVHEVPGEPAKRPLIEGAPSA